MACLCIGGVCIPYTAAVPFLLFALRWLAAQFARFGLLPGFVAGRLGLTTSGKKVVTVDEKRNTVCGTGCCSAAAPPPSSCASSSASSGGTGSVEHIDSLARWDELHAAGDTAASPLFVKFTAEWCKPCKAIQPAYERCAAGGGGTFVTLDIDGEECDALSGRYKVAMMPTFLCLRDGTEVGRMTGGNSGDALAGWVAEMRSGGGCSAGGGCCASEKKPAACCR